MEKDIGEVKQAWALITGASGSLGKAIAFVLAEAGYQLILHYHQNKAAVLNLQAQLIDKYNLNASQCLLWQYDLNMLEQLSQSLVAFFQLNRVEKLDLLINNAAIDAYQQINDLEIAELKQLLNVNIAAPLYLVKVLLPYLKKASQAQIINISSIWGNYGASMEVAYASSKGAINAMTVSLAKELASLQIRCNAVAPGLFDSSMNDRFSNKEIADFTSDHSLLARAASAKEVAEVVAFLASPNANYINAQILEVSGGYI